MPALVIGLIGAALILIGWLQYRTLRASRAWPSTAGSIVSGRVVAETQRGGDDDGDSTSYYAQIEYEYPVGAVLYRGTRLRFDRRGYSRPKGAEAVLAAYPLGRRVEVFYDPSQPGNAVLERKNSGGIVLLIVGGVLVLAAAATALAR